ncbi:hypothetical protein I302_106993 [Kwoniella bestiolae CBS 10118]|uniref:Uncharacterized protein n=1 Tax=Kwoniella bestiolae CBS 10118 TaxID=1296100 RepID=A0AAJ8KCW1_9TREE
MYPEGEYLKEKTGCNSVRITNTVSPEQGVPVALYQISDTDGQSVNTKIGTAVARFASEYAIDVEIPDFIYLPDSYRTQEQFEGKDVTLTQLETWQELMPNISRIEAVADLYGKNGRPGWEIDTWLKQDSARVSADSIDPTSNTIVSIDKNTLSAEPFLLRLKERDSKPIEYISVLAKTHARRSIVYSEFKWEAQPLAAD